CQKGRREQGGGQEQGAGCKEQRRGQRQGRQEIFEARRSPRDQEGCAQSHSPPGEGRASRQQGSRQEITCFSRAHSRRRADKTHSWPLPFGRGNPFFYLAFSSKPASLEPPASPGEARPSAIRRAPRERARTRQVRKRP